jgi:hypothetical protein
MNQPNPNIAAQAVGSNPIARELGVIDDGPFGLVSARGETDARE